MSTSDNNISSTASKNDSNKSNSPNNSNNSNNNSNNSSNNSNTKYNNTEESNNSAGMNPLPDMFTGYLPSPIPNAVIPSQIPYPPNSSSSYINSFTKCYVAAFKSSWSPAFIQGFKSFKGAPIYVPPVPQSSNDDTTTTRGEDEEDDEDEENEEDTEIKQIAVQDGGAEPYPEDTRDPHEEEGPEPYPEDFIES